MSRCGGKRRPQNGGPSLGDLLTSRPTGLIEPESWAILCQAVQALQDLFLSDGASGDSSIPLVTPSTLLLSSRGRVKLCQNNGFGCGPPAHLAGYLAPEYRTHRRFTDTDVEKMWIFSLGETLKRATLTSHAATSRLSSELCQVLTDMTTIQASSRASLMHLLDVISSYCTRRQQNRPFSHIVMDLYQEAMAAVELALDTPWGPPAMPELRPRTKNRITTDTSAEFSTLPRRWMSLTNKNVQKSTKEASTSMEDLATNNLLLKSNMPGSVVRPKSMCVSDMKYFNQNTTNECHVHDMPPPLPPPNDLSTGRNRQQPPKGSNLQYLHCVNEEGSSRTTTLVRTSNLVVDEFPEKSRRLKVRRNPVQRAASRLYRVALNNTPALFNEDECYFVRDCVGPEFVVRAALPNKQFQMADCKTNAKRTITVIMLNGQKLDVVCNPSATTAGQLFELIIQKEHIEENFMLGLSALIAGDFVFLPSDTRISKAFPTSDTGQINPTLFMRVRFFLPSLRGIRATQARHLLYLQLRRSILEHQLPCSFTQLIELNGLALQAEFGDFNEREHGTRDYFLLEHYVPETMSCVVDDTKRLRQELIASHQMKSGLEVDKAEEDFIRGAQKLPHYGGHFYTATWMLKDNSNKDVWLYISAQGINLYDRTKTTSNCGPQLYETFEWRSIQTLCYSKQYLCIIPHTKVHSSKLKKYKLRMDNKKSYFTFRLASLHHQFFLRLRTEFTSLQSLSQQFGIPLKDMKNETNSLYKLEALTNAQYLDQASVNADKEFKVEFRQESKRSQSVCDLQTHALEENQNKENENPKFEANFLSGTISNDKRRGVKMGTKVFSNMAPRVCRSMETVNASNHEYLEELSLQSVSLHCSSTSISTNEVYILDSVKTNTAQFLPDFQETLSESLVDKLNNMSFLEERILSTVTVERDSKGSLGLQITEGSDGNVYVQSVIVGGPAHLAGNVKSGDQVIAVDGQALLGMRYNEALNLLKNRGDKVEFILSRVNVKNQPVVNSPVEKHLTESCHDLANLNKYGTDVVPYHKHIRYEIEPETNNNNNATMMNKSLSKSCSQLFRDKDKAVVVEMIQKDYIHNGNNVHSLDRKYLLSEMIRKNDSGQTIDATIPPIALPRSLGLSRKWRGPVRYPVTPVKIKGIGFNDSDSYNNSDEDQVFI